MCQSWFERHWRNLQTVPPRWREYSGSQSTCQTQNPSQLLLTKCCWLSVNTANINCWWAFVHSQRWNIDGYLYTQTKMKCWYVFTQNQKWKVTKCSIQSKTRTLKLANTYLKMCCLWLSHVIKGHINSIVHLINDHGMSLRECTTSDILATYAYVITWQSTKVWGDKYLKRCIGRLYRW